MARRNSKSPENPFVSLAKKAQAGNKTARDDLWVRFKSIAERQHEANLTTLRESQIKRKRPLIREIELYLAELQSQRRKNSSVA